MTPSDSLGAYEVALRVAAALDEIGVPYFLGGSLASSLQGEPRATNDIDLVIDMPTHQVAAFARALGLDFEVDEEPLVDAIEQRRSWNIYFLPLVMKVDLFQKGAGTFDDSEFTRRRRFELSPGKALWVKSAEDSIVRKLLWFREGGSVSSHQWRDILEILRVSGATLEFPYLREWTSKLGLSELFERAQTEVR